VCGLPLASLLVELVVGWGTGATSDSASCLWWTRAMLLRLSTGGTLILTYRHLPTPHLISSLNITFLIEAVASVNNIWKTETKV
jgi:hypothetical protein